MKILCILTLAMPVLVTMASSQTAPRPLPASPLLASPSATGAAHESPFACDRLALTPAERTRHFDELGPALRRIVKGVRDAPDGYEFEFPTISGTIEMVAEWAAGERLCCPFFDIDMRLDREHGSFWLRLTGRQGTREFIRSDFGEWFKK